MLALRDVPYAGLSSVFVLAGMSRSDLEALPAALRSVIALRPAAQRRWPGSAVLERHVSRSSIDLLVSRSTRRFDDSMSDAELTVAAQRAGFSGLPVTLILTPTRAVVTVAHGVFDGPGSVRLLTDLLTAVDRRDLAAEQPPVRLPVLRALAGVPRAELRSAMVTLSKRARARIARRQHPTDLRRASSAPGTSGQQTRRARSTSFRLSTEDVQAVGRWAPAGSRGRATPSARLGALLLLALRESYVGEDDRDVVMTVDLRHRVRGHVPGNFVFAGVIGKLRSDDWTPRLVAARTLALLSTRSLLSLSIEWARFLADRTVRSGTAPGSMLYLSVVQDVDSAAVTLPFTTVTVASFGDDCSPTFVFGWRRANSIDVSVWDESGGFLLNGFEGRVRAALSSAEE